MLKIATNKIAKYFNGYITIIVVMNFCENFPIKVSRHLRKYFSAQNNSSLQYIVLSVTSLVSVFVFKMWPRTT